MPNFLSPTDSRPKCYLLHRQPKGSRLTSSLRQSRIGGETVQSPQREIRLEMLRARYAELLRLREYVERLENLRDEQTHPNTAADVIRESRNLLMRAE